MKMTQKLAFLFGTLGFGLVVPQTSQAAYYPSGPGCSGYASNWRPTAYSSRAVTDASCINHTHADSSDYTVSSTGYYTGETIYATPGSSSHHNGTGSSGFFLYY